MGGNSHSWKMTGHSWEIALFWGEDDNGISMGDIKLWETSTSFLGENNSLEM